MKPATLYKVILILSWIFLAPIAFSQFKLDENAEKGLTLGAFGLIEIEGILVGPEFGIVRKHHSFQFGLGNNISAYPRFRSWGGNFNYSYYPNGQSNRFDLFFNYNLVAAYRYYSSKSQGFLQSHLLGYGFNINFSQRCFLATSLGFGIQTYNFAYGDFSGDIMIRLSLGFRL
ncbi:MAG: hypothetical protein QE487_09955 [Fluviicola sp.]|nr:hypothetical protein [Fluviicola sp.]